MFQIDLKSNKAIYEQIVDNFKRLIVTGALREDEKVPSIRELSKTLMVNPNTIQKAYKELESQSYFYTVLGQGSFISPPPANGASAKEIQSLYENLRALVQQLLFLGEPMELILDHTKKFEGGGSNVSGND